MVNARQFSLPLLGMVDVGGGGGVGVGGGRGRGEMRNTVGCRSVQKSVTLVLLYPSTVQFDSEHLLTYLFSTL